MCVAAALTLSSTSIGICRFLANQIANITFQRIKKVKKCAPKRDTLILAKAGKEAKKAPRREIGNP